MRPERCLDLIHGVGRRHGPDLGRDAGRQAGVTTVQDAATGHVAVVVPETELPQPPRIDHRDVKTGIRG